MTHQYFWVNAFFFFLKCVRLYQEELQVINISEKVYRIWQIQMILLYCVLLQDSALIMVLWLHGKLFLFKQLYRSTCKVDMRVQNLFLCWLNDILRALLWHRFLCNCVAAQERHWKVTCRTGGAPQYCWHALRAKVSTAHSQVPSSLLTVGTGRGGGHMKKRHKLLRNLPAALKFFFKSYFPRQL